MKELTPKDRYRIDLAATKYCNQARHTQAVKNALYKGYIAGATEERLSTLTASTDSLALDAKKVKP